MAKFKDTDIQSLIGWVLRIGIIISVGIVFIGGIFYLYRHGHTVANYNVFNGIPGFLQHPESLVKGVYDLKGQAIIQIGIVLLIATPVLRIIFSILGFVLEKDYMYVGISLLVLFIIFMSLMNGHTG